MSSARRSRPDPTPTDLQRRALAAYELGGVSAEGARSAALAVIAEATADPVAHVVALRALALATRRIEGAREALRIIRDAIALATAHGLAKHLAECRMTYAAILADTGRIDAALKQCDAARPQLRGTEGGRLLAQRALILSRASRTEEALADYSRALPLLRAAGDTIFQVNLLMNRANVFAYIGRINAAERDLVDAIALANTRGLRDYAAQAAENLGFIMTRKGDVPAALRLFGEAIDHHDGYLRFTAIHDRAEALLAVGLAEEASRSLHAAIDAVAAAGFAVDVAEWQLMAAQASLASGDAQTAISYARKARTEFRKQGRPRWALLAQHLEIRARWTEGERTARLATAARDAHAKLAAAGWQVVRVWEHESLDAAIAAVVAALNGRLTGRAAPDSTG